MTKKVIGIVVLVIIIAVGLIINYSMKGDKEAKDGGDGNKSGSALTLKGYMGGEKKGFLDDPEVKEILKDKYKITLDATKAGSIEMVQGDTQGLDFLWPSSQVALELFKMQSGKKIVKSEIIFNSPIVLYSWGLVTEALIKEGIVQKRENSYYIVDLPKLIQYVVDGKKWSEIGLNQLNGKIVIISTDPTKSNSGNMFSGLLASILNNGEVVDKASLNKVLPTVVQFYQKLGFLESSSGTLFQKYLKLGVGANPIVVGYESQIIEFSKEHPKDWSKLKNKQFTILYPEPTVWSSHPLIALTPDAKKLITALMDEEIQKLAWEKHGFRTGVTGIINDPSVLDIVGIPESITKVLRMPHPEVMNQIIEALKN